MIHDYRSYTHHKRRNDSASIPIATLQLKHSDVNSPPPIQRVDHAKILHVLACMNKREKSLFRSDTNKHVAMEDSSSYSSVVLLVSGVVVILNSGYSGSNHLIVVALIVSAPELFDASSQSDDKPIVTDTSFVDASSCW